MDMFWCMAVMLLVASVLNVRKSKGGDVLNREQTEEWKGWMQFMFLNYHYFSAHEVQFRGGRGKVARECACVLPRLPENRESILHSRFEKYLCVCIIYGVHAQVCIYVLHQVFEEVLGGTSFVL